MTLDNRVRETGKRSAWREPMVWLVALIPALAVIGTIALFVAASRSAGTDDAVADHVRRTAQVQVADLGPDAMAKQLGLSAVVRSGKGVVEVLPVADAFERDAMLTLVLNHPSHADLDRELVLLPTDAGWRSASEIDLSHDWNVQLGPPGGTWRLQGRWQAGQQATYLHSALDASP